MPSAAPHYIQTTQRLERPQENSTGQSSSLTDQVGAPVHSVGEIDVPEAGWSEQRRVPRIPPVEIAVRSRVVEPEVGFRLHDPGFGHLTTYGGNDTHTEEICRNHFGLPL